MSRWEQIVIAYYEGDLSRDEVEKLFRLKSSEKEVEKLFKNYAELYSLIENETQYEPSDIAKKRFDQFISEEIYKDSFKRNIQNNWVSYTVAACISFGLIFFAYQYTMNKSINNSINLVRSDIQLMLLNESPSERIKAITVGYKEMDVKIDTHMLNMLITLLQNDPSSNVRLAAVDVLGDYIHIDEIRTVLTRALKNEDDVGVKIGIIQAISASPKEGTKRILERIIDNQELESFIRDEANMQLIHLEKI